MDIRTEIDNLKSTLKSNEEIILISFNSFEPVNIELIQMIEEKIKTKLPSVLLKFFTTTNGLQVRWQYKKNEIEYLKDIEISGEPFNWLWPAEHYWQLDGIINILPLEKIFLEDYKDFIWFDFEKDYSVTWKENNIRLDEFKKKIKPFDVFDKYYTISIYSADPSLPVLLGEDHNADFLNYQARTLEEYFSSLFESLGEVEKRKNLFVNGK